MIFLSERGGLVVESTPTRRVRRNGEELGPRTDSIPTRTPPGTALGFFDVYPENDNATFTGGIWSNDAHYDSKSVAVSSIDRGLFGLNPRPRLDLAPADRADGTMRKSR